MMPMNSDSAMSRRVPAPSTTAPMKRIDPTGRMATIDVLMDRTRVWLTARFTDCANVRRDSCPSSAVFSRILSNTTTVS